MLPSNPSSVNRIRRTPIKNTCLFAYNSEKGKRFKTEISVLKALKNKQKHVQAVPCGYLENGDP